MAPKLNNVNRVSISPGNKKMGAIPSVSLPPVKTCNADCTCTEKCYALKICRLRKVVREAYERNFSILKANPNSFWSQVEVAIMTSRYFRFHVAGDIVDGEYLEKMVELAVKHSHTEILCFTKKYEIVNAWMAANNGQLPSNLHILFSAWPGMEMENPFDLPEAHVIFKGQEPKPEWKICGGNCTECACQGVGCWELKRGEQIAFYEH